NGSGGYTSPAGDAGTLTAATAGGVTTYTYTMASGSTRAFDAAGRMVAWRSGDGFEAIRYTYSGSNLATVATADGSRGTFTYGGTGGLLSTIQAGDRTTTLTHGGTDLTGITDPTGGLRTLTYDGSHRLTRDQYGKLDTAYAYNYGALASLTRSG